MVVDMADVGRELKVAGETASGGEGSKQLEMMVENATTSERLAADEEAN